MPISASAEARAVAISTRFADLRNSNSVRLPQKIAVIGQGATSGVYATTPQAITSSAQAGTLYGFGTPLELVGKMLFPPNGDGVGQIPVTYYPLVDDGSAAPATGNIAASGTQTAAASYVVRVNGIDSAPFVIDAGVVVPLVVANKIIAAVNGVLSMPLTAVTNGTGVDMVSKWEGVSANRCTIEIVGSDLGTVFALTQPAGGLVNPDVDAALANIGPLDWRTLVINCMQDDDDATLTKFAAWGEGRWGALSHTPAVVLTGSSLGQVAASVLTSTRTLDRINGFIRVPGSGSLPFMIAARGAARIAVVANENPARDFGGQVLDGILPGADSAQEDYTVQNAGVTTGVSSSNVIDGVVKLADTVTFYRPVGETPPAFQFVKTIVKVSQALHNLDLIFNSAEWDGAPIIPDDQDTVNPAARQPKDAITDANAMIDGLGLDAIISDPKTAKTKTTAVFSDVNQDRLDVGVVVQVSGNANIIDIDLAYGFFFG